MNGQILVIADDFTGAAEIAGIGSRFGLDAEIIRDPSLDSAASLLVIDTDSRSLPATQAARRVREFLTIVRAGEFDLVFKKVDSLLRGPVLAELESAMRALKRSAAILMPANPSRSRTISNGEYRIDGVRLHQTSLADDPEYPRRSSMVQDLIGPAPANVALADATSERDVQRIAAKVDDAVLPAGAADFFAAMLARRGITPVAPSAALGNGSILMVCGSAAESSSIAVSNAVDRGVPVFPLPENLEEWPPTVCRALDERSCAIITAGSSPSTNLARTVAEILGKQDVGELLIEGGSTAATILGEMRWRRFTHCRELVPGVVRMQIPGASLLVTAKPGSYPWPEDVWQRLFSAAAAPRRPD